jgi:non-heme chloroperoxidase
LGWRLFEDRTMPHIAAQDGTKLYYKDWGAGAPVVLVHGWPVNADMWESQAVFLANQGLRVISYDRRGFGRSDQPWEGYDYDTMAGDLAAVMDQLDLQKATLVGFSMGGGEVARYLGKHGSARVARAALVSAVTPYLLQTDDNPEGVPQSVFDGMYDGLGKTGRSS